MHLGGVNAYGVITEKSTRDSTYPYHVTFDLKRFRKGYDRKS